MGYSYGNSNGPLMCFNSAKSWQFGWYDQRHHTVDASSNRAYLGKLVSILDNPNIVGTGDPMIIKIETGTSTDYFINFNRKTGFNSETQEGGNQVLITVAGEGNNYSESNLQAKLNAGQAWDATVGTETVTVTVNAINLIGNGFADVDICFGQCPVETPAPTAVPTTSPTNRPTAGPIAVPTTSPTNRPTAVPTTTKAPTAVPVTKSPTASPTKSPATSATINVFVGVEAG